MWTEIAPQVPRRFFAGGLPLLHGCFDAVVPIPDTSLQVPQRCSAYAPDSAAQVLRSYCAVPYTLLGKCR
jgi:hypothetical protein